MTEAANAETVLIIEDDDQIAYLLTFMLEREGYTVVGATDGQIAHDLINKIEPPKLVLLDVMLPFIDGFDLIKLIKSKTEWESVPEGSPQNYASHCALNCC